MACFHIFQVRGSKVCQCKFEPVPWCYRCMRGRLEQTPTPPQKQQQKNNNKTTKKQKNNNKYLFRTLEMPKSPSFTTPDLVRKMFWVLMSLCKIFLSWTCFRPRQICTNQFNTCTNEYFLLSYLVLSVWRRLKTQCGTCSPCLLELAVLFGR